MIDNIVRKNWLVTEEGNTPKHLMLLQHFTIAFSSTFVYIAHHFNLLRLNPFDLSFEREGWCFEHSVS